MALLGIDVFPLSAFVLIGEGLSQDQPGHACALWTDFNTAPISLTIIRIVLLIIGQAMSVLGPEGCGGIVAVYTPLYEHVVGEYAVTSCWG